jgi:TolB-like protein
MADLIRLEPPTVELSEDEIPTLRKVYYEVRKELSGGYEVEHDPGVHTMAIMGFTNNSLEDRERYDPLEWGISSMLISSLQGATELKVIERERLKWILEEHQLQSDPSKVDQSTAVRMGKLLGAQTMLVGQLMVVGDKMRVDARLIDVETSEVLMTEQVTEKAKDLFDIIDKLSLKVAKGVNLTANELNQSASPRTSSLDAQLSYSEGLELIEKESYGLAYDKFLEALDYDPAFALAKRKADSIKPYLAVNSADG